MQTSPRTILRLPQVELRTGLSKATIYRLISKGTFPKQIKLGERSSGFIEADIENWLASKESESKSANAGD
jgi:prophage regulatory protein